MMRSFTTSTGCGPLSILVAGVALLTLPAQAAPMFMGLGDLPGGGLFSSARAVSADGSTVVGDSHGSSGWEAFRWTGGVMTGLGRLPGEPASGAVISGAWAVSADGSTVVGNALGPSGGEAFRWTGGVMTGLGDLPGGSYSSRATGVSADGATVVGNSTGASGNEAFRWTGGVMTGLGDLPGGSQSQAWAVSPDGATVTGSATVAGEVRAFRWTGGVMTDIGPGAGRAISSDGSTIVGTDGEDSFRWRDGARTPLEEFAANPTSWAYGVSADGSIVVGEAGIPGNLGSSRAVVWDAANGIHVLDQVLTDLGFDLTGWTLSSATGISGDGLTIVGLGINPDGFSESWIAVIPSIAVIPEPDTALLLGLGLLGLAVRRRS